MVSSAIGSSIAPPRRALTAEAAREVVGSVPDPELPFVTVADLGVLRDVSVADGRVVVTITPTYSGCPAMKEILTDVRRRLADAGAVDAEIRVALSPPWTTDWITADGHRKLEQAGIAPPAPTPAGPVPIALSVRPQPATCPRCGSRNTEQLAAFSATACLAAHRCRDCGEPFDRVKAI